MQQQGPVCHQEQLAAMCHDQSILSVLEAQAEAVDPVEHGAALARPYRAEKGIMVLLHHPGDSASTNIVYPRSLSRHGITFLHGSFVYGETRCIVKLPRSEGEPMLIPGRVVRCTHVHGKVHEVGVQFTSPIEPNRYR